MSIPWLLIAAFLGVTAWKAPLGRILRGLLVIAVIAAAGVGFGLIELPTIEEVVTEIGTRLGKWSYLVVGINAFLETGAFIGFIAPGETVVLFGGVLAGAGTIELIPLIAVVWISALLGDVTSYCVGRRYGRDFLLRHGARFRIGEPQVNAVEAFFDRHGQMTVLLGRWVGVIRPLVPFMAGSSRLPFLRFAIVDVIATGIWAIGLCVLGSVFWQNFDELTSIVGRTLLAIGTLIVVLTILVGGVSLRRNPPRARRIDTWLQRQHDEQTLLAVPASLLWATIGRIEQLLRRGRRRPEGRPDTVQQPPDPTDAPNDR